MLSQMFVAWFDPFLWKGFRNPLKLEDLWEMSFKDSSREVIRTFSKNWKRTMIKSTKQHSKQASILLPIIETFGLTYMLSFFLKMFLDVLAFAQPQLLRLLIQFVDKSSSKSTLLNGTDESVHETSMFQSQPEPLWRGIFFAILIFLVASTETLFTAQYFQRMNMLGLRIRTAIIGAIFRKALIISNSARKKSAVGEIVNLMSVDAQLIMDLVISINMIWSAPIKIGLAMYFLWEILGPSVLAGLAAMIVLTIVSSLISKRIKNLKTNQMKCKDERVKLMGEILNGMKILKLYAWEPSFAARVLEVREGEFKMLKANAYLQSGTTFIWNCAPFLVRI